VRIAYFLAKCGLGSRRDCEQLVVNKLVTINNTLVTECATKVQEQDIVRYRNRALKFNPSKLFLYDKSPGLIVSTQDDRPTVFQDLAEIPYRLISVGRLDFMSEGLMLMATDPLVAHHWETSVVTRRYVVRTYIPPYATQAHQAPWNQALEVNGVVYKAIQLIKVHQERTHIFDLTVDITEGKNREIRKIWDSYEWKIQKLIRSRYGPFRIDDLHGKKWIETEVILPPLDA